MPISTPFDALSLGMRIGAVGTAVTSAELLVHRRHVGPAGVLDAEVQLTRVGWLVRAPLGGLAPALAAPSTALALLTLRLAACLALIVGGGHFEVARAGVVAVAVATIGLRLRSSAWIHPAGSMVLLPFTVASLGLLVGSERALRVTVLFIGLEAGLAYLVAGCSKLAEPGWRRGRVLARIASTDMWGDRRSALVLRARPRLGLAICWATMVVECAVPLALVLPVPAGLAILACAGAFHVATAVQMRLNAFPWSFGSTYPAILFCAHWLHHAH